MFLSLLPVEKPALGRGLDALMSGRKGDSGKKASEMLMPFQAKRTRVGKGLSAFLKGGQRVASPARPGPASAPQPAVQPTAAAPKSAPTPAPATPAPQALASLRAARASRPAAPSVPTQSPLPAAYRRTRRPRAPKAAAPHSPDKTEPAPARAAAPVPSVPANGSGVARGPAPAKAKAAPDSEPAFQRPFVRQRPPYLRKEDIPRAPEPAGASPAFRLSLFVVDLFLSGGAFYVAYHGPKGNAVLLFFCCLAVVIGAALGVWAFKLEPEDETQD